MRKAIILVILIMLFSLTGCSSIRENDTFVTCEEMRQESFSSKDIPHESSLPIPSSSAFSELQVEIPPQPEVIGQPLSIMTDSSNLAEIGKMLLEQYLDRFVDSSLPKYHQLADYRTNQITVIAGTIEEFAVAFEYDYHYVVGKLGTYHLSANGEYDGNNGYSGAYLEFRIQRTAEKTYSVISQGTGGAGIGLVTPPVG